MQRKTKMQEELEKLMEKWSAYSKKMWGKAHFIKDGAFPKYEEQKTKILFIAREAYGMPRDDYWTAWENEEFRVTDNFHSRLLYIAFGVLQGKCTYEDWLKMAPAEELNKKLGVEKNFSFAFMNASKLDNNSGSSRVGAGSFFDFVSKPENQEFFLKEIEILSPDIIISGNLGDVGFMRPFLNLKKSSKDKTVQVMEKSNENCLYYKLTLGDKQIPWLDGWHFSAWRGVADFENFYHPICTKAKEILNKKK